MLFTRLIQKMAIALVVGESLPKSSTQIDTNRGYHRYGEVVYRRGVLLLPNEVMAWEVIQESFMVAHQQRFSCPRQGSPLRWLLRIADRQCYTLLSKSTPTLYSELEEFIQGVLKGNGGGMMQAICEEIAPLGDWEIESRPELANYIQERRIDQQAFFTVYPVLPLADMYRGEKEPFFSLLRFLTSTGQPKAS